MEPKAHPQLRKAEKAYDAAETNAHKWRQFLSMIGGTATGGATGAGLGYMGGAGLRALGANVNPASAAKAVGYPSAAVGAMLGSLLGGSHGQSDVDLGRAHERLWNAEQKYASPRISLYSFFDELKQIPSGGFGKIAKELTEAARGKIKAKNFALTPGQSSTGEKAYPIQDRAHASNALSRVAQHGSPKPLASSIRATMNPVSRPRS